MRNESHNSALRAGEQAEYGARRETLWDAFERAPEKHREEARRRADLVRAVEGLVASGERIMRAISIVSESRVGERSLGRYWREAQRWQPEDWLAAMLPGWQGCGVAPRTNMAEADAIYDRFKGLYLARSRRGFAQCWRLAVEAVLKIPAASDEFEKWRGRIPSMVAMRRRLQREIPRAAIVAARHGDDALKREYPHQTRDRSIFRAMEAVNADGRRSKCYVKWHDGTVERPVIFSIQDLRSGKRVAWRIDKSENRDCVRLTVGDMARDYGLPDHFYIDNTHAMANKWLTGRSPTLFRFTIRDEDPEGILVSLGIKVHFTTPHWGQAKPVERQHRDDIPELDRHPALAAAMAEKHAVPVEVFQSVMDQVFRAENARLGRRGRGMNGRSYDEAFEASYSKGPVRRAVESQLRMCMLAADSVTVRANGEIHLFGNRYFGGAMPEVAGDRAIVRFDPARLHDGVHIYSLDGRYLGHAPCLEAAGFNDSHAARELARRRTRWMRSQKAVLEEERRIDEIAVSQELSGRALERSRPNTRLVAMMDEPQWARETRKRAPAIHPDRDILDRQAAEVERELAARNSAYDENEEARRVVAELELLLARRASWTAEEKERVLQLRPLPEIRAFLSRRDALSLDSELADEPRALNEGRRRA